ncbi:MAG: exo-alpha-sialidase [Clostridia bacterium]|nr:exo-alpha-sialidase [Clostridia bacterium]
MRKKGREVLFMSANKYNRRKGEGDFIRLKDGRIMYAFTEMLGENSFDDFDFSQISAIYSSDEGETWGDKKVLFETDKDCLNSISVSLIRFDNENIGLFYCMPYKDEQGDIKSKILCYRSSDEGKTWGKRLIISNKFYEYPANQRVIKLKNGRIILPVNRHKNLPNGQISFDSESRFYFSDDDGYTFYDSGNSYTCSYARSGLQETGVIEMENGKLFAFSRTSCGSQFESFSEDNGDSWTEPRPSSIFFSPGAPMTVTHLKGNKTIAVWNPIPNYPGRKDSEHEWSRRTPMIGIICDGEGENLFNGNNIPMVFEDDDWNSYCYPSIFAGDDYFLIAYYHSNNTKLTLNSLKMIKVEYKDIYPEEN